MATRSTIALEYANGVVDQIYCHWDGYLENNGQLLQEYYKDAFKLQELMDLGDMSSLGETVSGCAFYMRDKGESDCGARRYKDFQEYTRECQREEYDYVLRNVNGVATWFVSFYGTDGEYLTMDEAYAFQKAQNEECGDECY
jgi:hypothetical protein